MHSSSRVALIGSVAVAAPLAVVVGDNSLGVMVAAVMEVVGNAAAL